jgi:hypothetical protein
VKPPRRKAEALSTGAPADELDDDRVREVLVARHDRLRSLLKVLDASAAAVVRTEAPASGDLRALVENTAQTLDDHLRGEERALTTLSPRDARSGRLLTHLREEHERQRADVEAMRRLAAASDDRISLALAVRAFVADVGLDMDLEDQQLLTPRRASRGATN